MAEQPSQKEQFLNQIAALDSIYPFKGGHSPLPVSEELTPRTRLQLMIMMQSPINELEPLLGELENLGTYLHKEYQLAQAFERNDLIERLSSYSEVKTKRGPSAKG